MIKYQPAHNVGDRANIKGLQKTFGERPGNYSVDRFYFRTGIGNKPYYWDDYERKWKLLKDGMEFELDDDGIMVRVDG